MKKILSVMLSLCLILLLYIPTSAAGAEISVPEYAALIEDKFGITITYAVENGKDAISVNTLLTLDKALSNMTGAVVRQVSDYYEQTNGKRLEITYITSENKYVLGGGVLMAAFEKKTSKIYVFMPAEPGKAIISGENPVAFVHEFAHAFHEMAQQLYGREKMRAEWAKFNKGYGYNPRLIAENPNDTVFMSAYSTYSFEEDFAEVFSHTFVRNAPGTGFKDKLSKNSAPTSLGQKVTYVEKLIQFILEDTEQAISNYRRIYDTAVSVRFEGIIFSGEHLQYSGYPQPRNVLEGILNGLKVKAKKATWIRPLGAWRVIDQKDNMLYIFPGGMWMSRKSAALTKPGEAA